MTLFKLTISRYNILKYCNGSDFKFYSFSVFSVDGLSITGGSIFLNL